MNRERWTELVEGTVTEIDDRIRRGDLPHHVVAFEDVMKHATAPFTCLDALSNVDRGNVVAGVDEVLRIRAGGVY